MPRPRQAEARARDAAAKAAEAPRTFDFAGVAQHLKNPHQVEVFRKIVTAVGVRPVLAVDEQAALAAHLVTQAQDRGQELSGEMIRGEIATLLWTGKTEARRETQREHEARLRADREAKAYDLAQTLLLRISQVATDGHTLNRFLLETSPPLTVREPPDFRHAIHLGLTTLETLAARFPLPPGQPAPRWAQDPHPRRSQAPRRWRPPPRATSWPTRRRSGMSAAVKEKEDTVDSSSLAVWLCENGMTLHVHRETLYICAAQESHLHAVGTVCDLAGKCAMRDEAAAQVVAAYPSELWEVWRTQPACCLCYDVDTQTWCDSATVVGENDEGRPYCLPLPDPFPGDEAAEPA